MIELQGNIFSIVLKDSVECLSFFSCTINPVGVLIFYIYSFTIRQ